MTRTQEDDVREQKKDPDIIDQGPLTNTACRRDISSTGHHSGRLSSSQLTGGGDEPDHGIVPLRSIHFFARNPKLILDRVHERERAPASGIHDTHQRPGTMCPFTNPRIRPNINDPTFEPSFQCLSLRSIRD